jgi:phosphoglycolate phosphatase-like HAD superfamily hydrolase
MFDVIVDIDGTIADNAHRQYFLNIMKDWDSYRELAINDGVHEDVIVVLKALKAIGCKLVLCTGRMERERTMTVDWLRKHDLFKLFSVLYMRKENDHREDYIVKKELLGQMRRDGYNPLMVFDDRDSVVKMWREAGLRCFQPQEGNF